MLTDRELWHKGILNMMEQLYDEMNDQCNPIKLLSMALSLCANIGDHIEEKKEQTNIDPSWFYVWKMTSYIHGNFDYKITVDDIAAAGSVSRSRCCQLFGKYIIQSPNAYLNKYRITKSCEMLQETDRSICEIAISCGFQSASYYTSMFRKELGVVPNEYRKQKKEL